MKFVLNLLFVLGCISAGFAQKPFIKVEVDFNEVEVGNPIVITVKSTVTGTLDINLPPEYIAGSGTQNGMHEEIDYNTGKTHTIYFFAQSGAFSKVGNYTIRALITNKNKVYRSKPITIKVVKQNGGSGNDEISKRNSKQPVFGEIERSKSKIYEGEPVVVNGKIFTKTAVKIQGYQPYEVTGNTEIISLNGNNDLVFTPEVIKGQKFATAEFEKQLLFYTSPGKYRINPFEMAVLYETEDLFVESTSFTSTATSIEVLPLPNNAPADFIGAVGKFKLDCSLNKKTVNQGDVVLLNCTVSGYGNLQNINTPVLNLPKGIVLYGDPEVEEHFSYGLRGAEGEMKYTFNLQVLQAGQIEIPALSISYFDPEAKKYITLSEEKYVINGQKSASFSARMPADLPVVKTEKKQLQALLKDEIKESDTSSFIGSRLFWPTVLSPIGLALLGALFYTKRQNIKAVISDRNQFNERLKSVQLSLHDATHFSSLNDYKTSFQSIENAMKELALIWLKSEANSLSKMEIKTGLKETSIDPKHVEMMLQILLTCEEARYGWIDSVHKLEQTIQDATELMLKEV